MTFDCVGALAGPIPVHHDTDSARSSLRLLNHALAKSDGSPTKLMLAPVFKPLTAAIIAFPSTPAKETAPDTAALLRRCWRATERLICALPSTTHPEQVEHADDLDSLIDLLEQVALTAEHTFKV